MVLPLEAVPGTGDVLDACGEGYWPVDIPPVSTLHSCAAGRTVMC